MSKKPAKRPVGDMTIKKQETLGKPILYVGTLGKSFQCLICNRELRKGIIYEYEGLRYCSKRCITPKDK
jgi:hypothetical protein